jgi:3-oxoacyl-[acyl-carrier-protein] synthase III
MLIVGTGTALPDTCVSNEEVESRLGLEPGWIFRRTGVRRRPTAALEQATSDLAVAAGRDALASAGIPQSDVGLLLLATSTPDHLLPPSAPLVASQLNLPCAGAVDLAGACSGFLYALVLAGTYCQACQKACLVIGANILTRRVDQRDPSTSLCLPMVPAPWF